MSVERAVLRVARRKSGVREEMYSAAVVQDLSVRCVFGWGRGLVQQGRVGGMKSRGIRGVVSWCPLRSGEGRGTANRDGQQLASRYRDHVRFEVTLNTRVESYVMMLQSAAEI